MVFLGGAVLADIMKTREEFWISKAEYDDMGPSKVLILYLLSCISRLTRPVPVPLHPQVRGPTVEVWLDNQDPITLSSYFATFSYTTSAFHSSPLRWW